MTKEDAELDARIKANLKISEGKEWRIKKLLMPSAEFKIHWAKERAGFRAAERKKRIEKGASTAAGLRSRDSEATAAAKKKKAKARTSRSGLTGKPSLRNL